MATFGNLSDRLTATFRNLRGKGKLTPADIDGTVREIRRALLASIGGISAFPLLAFYHASKWALEGFSQALSQEVADFGIHVTLIEPGGYETDWAGDSAAHTEPLPAYTDAREKVQAARAQRMGKRGDPAASAAVVLKLVDMPEPPLRAFFGITPLEMAKADYASRIANWEKLQPLAVEAFGAQD